MTTVTEESFEALVAARGPALLRLAVMLTGSAQDAEDLLQATLAKAWPNAERIAGMAAPAAYLRRIMVNEHLGSHRRRRLSVVPLGDHDLPAPDPTASRGSTDLAWRVLATLPPKQRATLVLRIYEDLADAEIAEILGSSEAAVRSNASRGLAALRTSISREDLEDR
jgi:RNA polymerase sigma-70 factor (sigma-E family)